MPNHVGRRARLSRLGSPTAVAISRGSPVAPQDGSRTVPSQCRISPAEASIGRTPGGTVVVEWMYADVVVSIRPETERAEAGADLGCCQTLPGAPRWDGGCCRSRVGCAPAGRSSELRHIGDVAAVAGACTLVVSGRGTRVGYGFGLRPPGQVPRDQANTAARWVWGPAGSDLARSARPSVRRRAVPREAVCGS